MMIVPDQSEKPDVPIHASLHRSNAKTFASLYEMVKNTKDKDKRTILKADRNVLQRLVTAYEAGRPVDLPSVLKHELLPVPVSLAKMNGTIRTGNKSVLADRLTEGIVLKQLNLTRRLASSLMDKHCFITQMKDLKKSMILKLTIFKRCCFCCMKPGHQSRTCYEQRKCEKPQCSKTHHSLLHEDLTQPIQSNTNSLNTEGGYLPVVKIYMIDDFGVKHEAIPMIDSGSLQSLIRKSFANKIRVQGSNPQNLKIKLAGGKDFTESSKLNELKMSAIHDLHVYKLNAMSLQTLYGDVGLVNKRLFSEHPHLTGVSDEIYQDGGKINLLIGTNFPTAFKDINSCYSSNPEAPIAKQSPLGRIIVFSKLAIFLSSFNLTIRSDPLCPTYLHRRGSSCIDLLFASNSVKEVRCQVVPRGDIDFMKFPPPFRGGCIRKYAKLFSRFCTVNEWSDKKACAILLTLLPDHLADLVEGWNDGKEDEEILIKDIFNKLVTEFSDSSDILSKIESVTLIDDQVESYVGNLKQLCGEQATDGLLTSALLRQLSAEMRQSAVLHTDGTLPQVTNHIKAYFRSKRSQPVMLGAVSATSQHHASNDHSQLLSQVLETQRQQQLLLQQQTELLKTLSLATSQYDHPRKNVRNNVQCYGCGQFGHIRCYCSRDGQAAPRPISSSAPTLPGNNQGAWSIQAQPRPFTSSIQIVTAMVDTGAARTVISENFVQILSLKSDPTSTVLQTPNGHTLSSVGFVTIDLNIEDILFQSVRCEVVRNLAVPFILGLDFLINAECHIDVSTNVISLYKNYFVLHKSSNLPRLVCGILSVSPEIRKRDSQVNDNINNSSDINPLDHNQDSINSLDNPCVSDKNQNNISSLSTHVNDSIELTDQAEAYAYGLGNNSEFHMPEVPVCIEKIISEFCDIFAEGKGLGNVTTEVFHIKMLPDALPVKCSPRRVSPAIMEELSSQIEDMLKKELLFAAQVHGLHLYR
ncbi:hypothetical protein GQR58_001811 [Nymphon striatum]|nr:hypothetical protein GQR58_001811 [Nymphon striatum]